MKNEDFLSTAQLSLIFTMLSPNTIQRYAKSGLIPIDHWNGEEPMFARTSEIARAMMMCGGLVEDVK
jgi:hypothetical protein